MISRSFFEYNWQIVGMLIVWYVLINITHFHAFVGSAEIAILLQKAIFHSGTAAEQREG